MKLVMLGALALVAIGAAPALAADLPARTYTKASPIVAPSFNWTGFYVGANAGFAWSKNDPDTTATCGANPPFYFSCSNQAVVQASGAGSRSANGFTGGIQAGYNWQSANIVFGSEVDIQAMRLRNSQAVASAYAGLAAGTPFTTTISTRTDWLSTIRGRLGWTLTPSLLLYGTGGLALTDAQVANNFTDVFNARGAASNNKTRVGWVAGAGAEWKVAASWSVKAEYLYMDFGRTSVSSIVVEPVGSPGASSLLTTSVNFREQIVRIGLNYQFGGPVVARY